MHLLSEAEFCHLTTDGRTSHLHQISFTFHSLILNEWKVNDKHFQQAVTLLRISNII